MCNRCIRGAECSMGEEQCGFRQCRGCLDQVFAIRQVCEKYLANGKDVFCSIMDLEKAYDSIDRHGMWKMLRVYGVGGKLLKAVQRFYVDSRVCLVGNDVNEWFPVHTSQGCVMSPWLFHVYMDGVVREVNVWVLGKGLVLLSANGGRFEINQLLLADDTALVADSEEKLCRLVSEFGRVCERRKLRVNVNI